MSGQLGELVISLQADVARFRDDMGKAARVSHDTSKQMADNFDKIGSAVTKTAGLLAGLAGVAGMGALIKSSIDAADNMSKMSQKVGVAIGQLSGMAYAASLADVSTEQLGKGMGKLAKAIYEAAGDSNSGPAKTFQALGVAVTDAGGKLRNTDAVMMDVAERMANMKDGTAKTALAMQVFGKAGADLIPLLNGGKQGMKEATDEARRFGLVLSAEAGRQAEEFNDNLTRLKARASGAAITIGNELLPAINSIGTAFVQSGTFGVTSFTQAIKTSIKATQEAAIYWGSAFDKKKAWVDSGGLVGMAFEKNRKEYAARIAAIKAGEFEQLTELDASYAPAKSAATGGTGGSDDKVVDALAKNRLIDKRKVYQEQIKVFLRSSWETAAKELAAEDFSRQVNDALAFKLSDPTLTFKVAKNPALNLGTGQLKSLEQQKAEADLQEQFADDEQKKADERARAMELISDISANTLAKKQLASLQKNHDEKMRMLYEFGLEEVITEEEKNAALLQEEENFQDQKKQLLEQTMKDGAAATADLFGGISDILKQGNKEQFEISKGFAIAQATINTYMAASNAFARSQNVVVGIIAAAAAVAAGIAQVAQISNTQYQARAAGGPTTAGQTYLIGEKGPELWTAGANGFVTPNNQLTGGRNVEVTNVYQISTGVSDTVRAEIMRAVPAITQHSMNAVQQAINGGTALTAAVGRM